MPETIKSDRLMAIITTVVCCCEKGGKEEDPIMLNRFEELHEPEVHRSGRGAEKQPNGRCCCQKAVLLS